MRALIKRWHIPFILILGVVALASKLVILLHTPLNSESATPAVIFYDMKEFGNFLLNDWYLPQNTYIFTDYPIHAFSAFIVGMSEVSVRSGALLIWLTCALFGALAIWRAFGEVCAGVFALAVLSMPISAAGILLQIFIHTGTVMCSLALLVIVTGVLFNRGSDRPFYRAALLGLLFIIFALTVFSDAYVLVIFAGPVVASLAVIWAMRRQGESKIWVTFAVVIAIALGYGLGMALFKVAESRGLHLMIFDLTEDLSVSGFGAKLGNVLRMFGRLFDIAFTSGRIIPSIITIVILGITAIYTIISFRSDTDPRRTFLRLYFFFFGSMLSFAMLLKDYNPDRYLAPIVFPVAAFIAMAIAGHGIRKAAIYKAFVAMCILLFVLNSAQGFFIDRGHEQPERSLGIFLRDQGLRYGYAEYWDSNVITLFTENQVQVRSVKFKPQGGGIIPYHWVSKAQWYHPTRQEGPTFIILPKEGGFDEGTAKRLFGPPKRVLKHDGRTVLVWEDNILRKSISTRLTDNAPLIIGRIEESNGGLVRSSKQGQSGKLAMSDPWKLYPGHYIVTFEVRASGAVSAGKVIGGVSIYRRNGIVASEAIKFSDEGFHRIGIDLQVDAMDEYAFIVSTTGATGLTVRPILVEKF